MAYSVVITQAKLMSIVHNTRSFVDHRRAKKRGTFLCKEIVHGCGNIRYRRERKIKGIYACNSDQQATSPVRNGGLEAVLHLPSGFTEAPSTISFPIHLVPYTSNASISSE
jgi:hypothetical protein